MLESERDRILTEWLAGHKAILFKVVHAYAFEHANRQDLFQEIVIQVWRSVDAFRGESSVPTWIFGPGHELTPEVREEIADYFRRYKEHDPGAFSNVPGWGSVADGRDLLAATHAFFQECPGAAGAACRVGH